MTCKCIGWCIIVRLFNVILVTCPPSIFILSVSARGTPFILRYSCIFPVRSGFLLLVHQQNSLSLPVTLDIVVFWKQIHSSIFISPSILSFCRISRYNFFLHVVLFIPSILEWSISIPSFADFWHIHLLALMSSFSSFHLRMIHVHSFPLDPSTYPFACHTLPYFEAFIFFSDDI
jgi:hypothetical protein